MKNHTEFIVQDDIEITPKMQKDTDDFFEMLEKEEELL